MNEQKMIQLVLEAQEGHRGSFGELMEHFESMIFTVVMSRLRNRAEALEVTQDVFMQALRKLDQLREPERFAGWLKQIAVRMSINRAVRKPKEVSQDPELFNVMTADPSNTLTTLIQEETAEQVREGLNKLRDLDRETLIAFYFHGQSLKEMSDQFQSPVGTIKRRLHMARNRLKEQLVDLQPA